MKRKHFPVKVNGSYITFSSVEDADYYINAMVEAGIIKPVDEAKESFLSFYELWENDSCCHCDGVECCEDCKKYGVDCGGIIDDRYYWSKPKGA